MKNYTLISIDNKPGNPEQVESLIPWLKNEWAEFREARIEINSYPIPSMSWISGIWYSGIFGDEFTTWYGGIWENGIWKDGLWKGGVWKNGKWIDGDWEGGTWLGGEWNTGRIYGQVSNQPPVEKLNLHNQIHNLKQNEITILKELRSIKNETLYGIADKLLKI